MSRQFARNSILGALAGSAVTLGSFLSGVIVARVLGVGASGAVAYSMWLVLMIALIADIGMSSAVVRFVSEIRGRGQIEEADRLAGRLVRILAIPMVVVIGAIVTIIFLPEQLRQAWSPRVGEPAGVVGFDGIAILVALCVTLQVFASFSYAYLRGVQDFKKVARLAAISLALQLAGVAIGSMWFGIAGAVAGYAAGQIVPALAVLRLARQGGPADRTLQERVARYARYAWAANVANGFVWSRLEVFFLERYWGVDEVALFTVALALTSIAAQGPVLLTTGILSFLSDKHGRSETESMKAAFATGTRLLAALSFPACLGMAAIMPALLPLIYGKAFAAAVPAAIVTTCAATIGVASIVATNLVQAVERNEFIFLSSVFGAVLAILAGFLLVPTFGVMGAAVSRASIQVTMVALGLWFVARQLGYPVPFASLARLFLAAFIAAASAAICIVAIDRSWSIALAIPVATATYVLALRLTCALPASDLALLTELARALPAPLVPVATRMLNFVGPSVSVTRPEREQEVA